MKKDFAYILGNGNSPKIIIFHETKLSYISGNRDSKKAFYISGNRTFRAQKKLKKPTLKKCFFISEGSSKAPKNQNLFYFFKESYE